MLTPSVSICTQNQKKIESNAMRSVYFPSSLSHFLPLSRMTLTKGRDQPLHSFSLLCSNTSTPLLVIKQTEHSALSAPAFVEMPPPPTSHSNAHLALYSPSPQPVARN